jgi:hypothetical protein
MAPFGTHPQSKQTGLRRANDGLLQRLRALSKSAIARTNGTATGTLAPIAPLATSLQAARDPLPLQSALIAGSVTYFLTGKAGVG